MGYGWDQMENDRFEIARERGDPCYLCRSNRNLISAKPQIEQN